MHDIIPLSLALIMFSMGLSLTLADFRRLLEQPKIICIGLVCQLLLLPAIALLISFVLQLNITLTLGLLLIALCPGGITSNLATRLAGGNSALSVSLTAISSVITIFTLPLALNLAVNIFNAGDSLGESSQAIQNLSLPLGPTVQKLATLTLLPLAIAMMIRHFFPIITQKHQAKAVGLASAAFIAIIVTVWVKQWENIVHAAATIGGTALALNVSSIALAWITSKHFRLDQADTTTLMLEVGLQNGALAAIVAMSVIGNAQLAIPASVYTIIMVCSAAVLISTRHTVSAMRVGTSQ